MGLVTKELELDSFVLVEDKKLVRMDYKVEVHMDCMKVVGKVDMVAVDMEHMDCILDLQ